MNIFLVPLIILILEMSLMKGLHIEKYSNHPVYGPHKVEEYDAEISVWEALFILISSIIPIVNILLFLIFISLYVILLANSPKDRSEYYEFSLNDKTFITRLILKVQKFIIKRH